MQNDTRDEAVVAEFRKRKIRQYLLAIPMVLAVALLLLGKRSDDGVQVIAGLGLIVAMVAFSFWNWRCPACNKYLGRGSAPTFCSKCGAALK